MEKKDVLSKVDHTLLSQTATWAEIKEILDDGIKYGCASACIPAAYVKQAAAYVDDESSGFQTKAGKRHVGGSTWNPVFLGAPSLERTGTQTGKAWNIADAGRSSW